MIKRLIDWQNQFRSFWQAAVGLVIIYCPVMGQASPPPITGPGPEEQSDLGEIFGNMFYIVLEVRGLMQSVFLVTAAGLFMGALVRYKKYKQNPVESPISSVFILLFVALALLALSFIPLQTDQAQD